MERPRTAEEVGALLRAASRAGRTVRPVGGGTKLGWGRPVPPPDLELSTLGLASVVEHNAADLTAVVEAGVRLGELQRLLGEAGQMLALDPPLGPGEGATVGGVVATGDSGPLRHRYGAPRDLVLGVTVALSDGTVARSGGKVIKNVAGYDLPKLIAGSFGTLGVICRVAVRLHPRPPAHATLVARAADPALLQRAAMALSHAPLELECLDLAWGGGEGRVLARFGGAAALARARAARALVPEADPEVVEDDDATWEAQRAGQRSSEGTVVRVSCLQTDLARVLAAAAGAGASAVGRAAAGTLWLTLPPAGVEEAVGQVEELRRSLAPLRCVVLDAPAAVREKVDVWGEEDPGLLALMRRVKARFDPTGTLNPGLFVEGR
ncbi:MAG TPA: FAD-binding oxidoreductase [Actinomycetota bacterium]|nr:FAD-binding oxidoreductase [Actinomycetota bacterium]